MKTLLHSLLLRFALVAGVFSLVTGSPRAADTIIQPSAVTSSTGASDLFPVGHLIDGSGLSGTPTPSSLGTHADATASPGHAHPHHDHG